SLLLVDLAPPLSLVFPYTTLFRTDFDKLKSLLEKVQGINIVQLARKDECCGFGGTFAVFEEAVSVAMGNDRIGDHERQGVEVITAADMSCLMHLEGLLKRKNSPI